MPFDLRFRRADDSVITLVQIAGGGRLRVTDGARTWWTKPPSHTTWEVFDADDSGAFQSKERAQEAAQNLTKAGRRTSRE